MIRLEAVRKAYGDSEVVAEMHLEMAEGSFTVLIGPSGCGKTTTLKMINRLIEPSSGRIFVNGQDIAEQNPQTLRRSIGYVIQSIGLFPHMTVQQNIQIVPDLLGWPKKKSAARAQELLERVGLDPQRYRHSYPSELSGGQAQRVGVARALAVDPPVLLMDEPFGAVDPITRERLQDEFLRLQEQLRKTVVMVTHDIDEAIKMADTVCVMRAGKLEQVDSPEAMLAQPKSRFVRQFVGSDRALKRLSRIAVGSFMQQVAWISSDMPLEVISQKLSHHRTLYVCRPSDDPQRPGVLLGWLERQAFEEAKTRLSDAADVVVEACSDIHSDSYGVLPEDDARDVLAKMLNQGVVEMPILNAQGELLGRVDMSAILAQASSNSQPDSLHTAQVSALTP